VRRSEKGITKTGDLMGKYAELGRARQIKYPHIRGRLSPEHHNAEVGKVVALDDWKDPEADESYFVPSFSIRRHLYRTEEEAWTASQKQVKQRLGRVYSAAQPEDISIKVIEQKALIHNMRKADIHPDPEDIWNLAVSLQDQLTDFQRSASSPLEVPLGKLGRFGSRDNSLAYEIAGWHGDKAHYGGYTTGALAGAMNESVGSSWRPDLYTGNMNTLALLQAERRLVVGAFALAYGEDGLDTDGLITTPHVTIARAKNTIGKKELHTVRTRLADIAVEGAMFGDPIIDVKLYRDAPTESLGVAHSWASLGSLALDTP